MNKAELIEAVVAKTGASKKDADAIVKATFDAIAEAMTNGDKVSLIGFGTFEVRERAAREGINPLTKEAIKIPAKTVASFKAGSKLKDAIN